MLLFKDGQKSTVCSGSAAGKSWWPGSNNTSLDRTVNC
jgi:hypothetical protein